MTPVQHAAADIAHDLFTTGDGQRAVRLVLVDGQGKDLGGWCQSAVRDRLTDALADLVRTVGRGPAANSKRRGSATNSAKDAARMTAKTGNKAGRSPAT